MSKRILTVDDSKTIRDMLRFTLTGADFDVVQAEDGVDGLRVLAANPDVDVIITDINMPNMDGFTFIEHVRQDAAHKSTPVLARQAGATGWIVKPFDPNKLLDVIRKVLP